MSLSLISYGDVLFPMAGSESVHSCCSVYPGFGSMYLLIPRVRFQVPFLGPGSQLKSGFACAGLLCITNLPSSTLPNSPFIRALETPTAQKAPPQTGTLAQSALEEWERTLCKNKAVAILAQMQAGRPALIQKDGGEMPIAIVLDRPLAEAKALVDDPAAFTREMIGS